MASLTVGINYFVYVRTVLIPKGNFRDPTDDKFGVDKKMEIEEKLEQRPKIPKQSMSSAVVLKTSTVL
jgi:hypothetical protein